VISQSFDNTESTLQLPEITIKGSAPTEQNNARSRIFVTRIAFTRAQLLSPATVYKTLDHVFIARALSQRTARHSIKKIQYLCERDLAAFCELARRGLRARDPRARRWKAAPLRVSIFARCSQTRDYHFVDICKRCCRRRDRARTIVESRCGSLALGYVIVPGDYRRLIMHPRGRRHPLRWIKVEHRNWD